MVSPYFPILQSADQAVESEKLGPVLTLVSNADTSLIGFGCALFFFRKSTQEFQKNIEKLIERPVLKHYLLQNSWLKSIHLVMHAHSKFQNYKSRAH